MRSTKSRSRSKANRGRSLGNVINRVFESSGPEGKVRGTPQQIIDKYNQLARDAMLAGDRVASENFQQHAEHYLRLLSEATREQEARREQQEREQREKQAQRDQEQRERQAQRERERQGRAERQGREPRPERQPERRAQEQADPRSAAAGPLDPADAPQPDIIDFTPPAELDDSILVDTPETRSPESRSPESRSPESRAQRPRRARASRKPSPVPEGGADPAADASPTAEHGPAEQPTGAAAQAGAERQPADSAAVDSVDEPPEGAAPARRRRSAAK